MISFFKKAFGNKSEEKTTPAKPAETDMQNNMPGKNEETRTPSETSDKSEELRGSEASNASKPTDAVPKPECPVYEYIKSHTQDGRLPDDFRIPWISGNWAPGAKDGVALYHMAPLQPDQARDQKILRALTLMSDEDNGNYTREIFGIFEELDQKTSIVRLFDEIIRVLAGNQASLNLMNLLNFGDWLICNGVSLLAVKMGLTVLAPFDVPFVEEVMTEFGVYDEFTYYAARTLSMEKWKNGNDELFALAKNVRGWGRIHAVRYLRPETQEIRDWLLFEGSDNGVLPQYSSDICLQKSGAVNRLDTGLSAREFEAIGNLIRTSLESGPCPGITNASHLLPKFLEKGKEFGVDPGLREMIKKAQS